MFEKKGPLCPLLNKTCIEAKCKFWVNVKGAHPQTGETMDRWDCTIAWQPMLMVELSKQQRSTAAATESYRNEIAKSAQQNLSFFAAFGEMVNKAAHDIRRLAALPHVSQPPQIESNGHEKNGAK